MKVEKNQKNLKTGKMANVILVSDDLTLAYNNIVNYYQLKLLIKIKQIF